jgi:formylglycine-generating enzyme required for sulfatase activity
MIAVPAPGGGISCIDSREVSRDDYASFLAAAPPIAAQPALCQQNGTFVPNPICTGTGSFYQGPGAGSHPQECVDWCDARAFCDWAGKRLCGAGDGGAVGVKDATNAKVDTWFNACSSGGTHAFPYGDSFQLGVCNENGKTSTSGGIAYPGCQADGAYAGVFDLSGNVAEWEDACFAAGDADMCLVRGGFYGKIYNSLDDGKAVRCDDGISPSHAIERMIEATGLGFRCCAR